jgi:hypothetical protein
VSDVRRVAPHVATLTCNPDRVRTALRFRLRCEIDLPSGGACPVRFSWIGPDRAAPSAELEARDENAAIAKATDLGWWFGKSLIACPRHAAPVALEALEPEEYARG